MGLSQGTRPAGKVEMTGPLLPLLCRHKRGRPVGILTHGNTDEQRHHLPHPFLLLLFSIRELFWSPGIFLQPAIPDL